MAARLIASLQPVGVKSAGNKLIQTRNGPFRSFFGYVMNTPTSTDDGFPVRCDVCGTSSLVNISRPPGDAVCPSCGSFLWVTANIERTKLSSFEPDLRVDLPSVLSREDARRKVSRAVAEAWDWTSEQESQLEAAIAGHERTLSTPIGGGLAVFQASVDWVDRCFTAIAAAPAGIRYHESDRECVHTVFLVVSSATGKADHLRSLERISRSLRWMMPSE